MVSLNPVDLFRYALGRFNNEVRMIFGKGASSIPVDEISYKDPTPM